MYLARQLVEAGHKVTLLTRGKKPVTFQIPDDTDDAYARYKGAVQHIAVDRQDTPALTDALSGKGFDGARLLAQTLGFQLPVLPPSACTLAQHSCGWARW